MEEIALSSLKKREHEDCQKALFLPISPPNLHLCPGPPHIFFSLFPERLVLMVPRLEESDRFSSFFFSPRPPTTIITSRERGEENQSKSALTASKHVLIPTSKRRKGGKNSPRPLDEKIGHLVPKEEEKEASATFRLLCAVRTQQQRLRREREKKKEFPPSTTRNDLADFSRAVAA